MILFLINWNTLILETEFINLFSTTINFTLVLDWISISFFFHIILISSCVSLYRSYYINDSPLIRRFIIIIILFISRIAIIVFRLNIISILLGWDGLGLTSYLLVTFYQNSKSGAAGIITALSNRIGDSALLTRIALLFQSQRWNFILSPINIINNYIVPIIILAAITKRAQIPFSAWLPAAIAAPTPVRALVHSSTLVTAGIYLIIRFHPTIIKRNSTIFLFIIGTLTTFIARLSACLETDIKKIIALSTLRQLGLITSTIALNLKTLAFFHLIAHATFKALLFIAGGKIIHERNTQDLRQIGFFITSIPVTIRALNVANLALCGIPFLTGFYSKDLIIESILEQNHSVILSIIFFFRLGLSTTYSIRISHLRTLNNINQPSSNSSTETIRPIISILTLTFFSICIGTILSWSIFYSPPSILIPSIKKLLPIIIIITGILIRIIITHQNFNWLLIKSILNEPIFQIWFLILISGNTLRIKTLSYSKKRIITNNRWLENLSRQRTFLNINNYTSILTKIQNHPTKTFLTLFGIIIIIQLI